MGKVSKQIKYDDIRTGEGHYNAMNERSIYEVDHTDGMVEQPTTNITAEIMLSKFDSDGHHCFWNSL